MEMSVIGGERDEYSKVSLLIRREYSFLPFPLYKDLRLQILTGFVEMTNIFATKEFRDRYEARARQNLLTEIESLHAGTE